MVSSTFVSVDYVLEFELLFVTQESVLRAVYAVICHKKLYLVIIRGAACKFFVLHTIVFGDNLLHANSVPVISFDVLFVAVEGLCYFILIDFSSDFSLVTNATRIYQPNQISLFEYTCL